MSKFARHPKARSASTSTRPGAAPKRKPRRALPGRWKHGPIPMIGLVGGIGAGKSAVAALLERRGAFVVDADAVGHALLQQTPARERVLKRFGDAIQADEAAADGTPEIDRRRLGAIVFADAGARRDLEAILHPAMRRTFERAIAREARRGRHAAVVLDAAVLFEAGWDNLCDIVAFVDAPRASRLARLVESRGWTSETLAAREASQLPLEEKRRRADLTFPNDAEPEALEPLIQKFWERRVAAPPGRRPRM